MDEDEETRHHPKCDNNWNELNELTLSVMANRTRYDRYKKTVVNATDTLAENFCKEKAYYKERILAMTSDLFDEQCENDDINRAHREYMKSCIEYLKWNDITEMVSADTRRNEDIAGVRLDLQMKIQETATATADKPEERGKIEDEETDADDETAIKFQNIISLANKMCIRKKTIEDFIVLKPSVGNSDKEINARLPKIRDYHNEILKRASDADADADH
jgi:hypothetical protein